MKLFANFAVLLSVECLTLDRRTASAILDRNRRANERLGASELREGNFERECVEEVCSAEEFHEVYDDIFASTKKLSKFKTCLKANPHSDTRTNSSKDYLRECFYREDIDSKTFCQGKPNGNYADPKNPKGFIQCHQNGQTTFTQCTIGLVWDNNRGICNWP